MHKYCSKPETAFIYTNTQSLPPSWDKLLPETHPLRSAALSLYEAIDLPDLSCFYALCGSEDEPQAIAYFQLLKVKPKHLNNNFLGGFQSLIIPFSLNVFKPSLLIAGHLFRHDIVNFYSKNLSNLDAFRAYENMINAVAKKSCATATLIKDVPESLVPFLQNFAPKYSLLRNDISMTMPIPAEWQNFDDYTKALKHKYAQKLRKVRSGMEAVRIEELNTEAVIANAEKIYDLYRQVSSHQNISLGLLSKDFLPELKKRQPEELKIWAFYEGEKMVAFASAWLHTDCFDMFYIGFDYERNAALSLYFNILYFSIEQAIVHKKQRLNLGRTALEAKARLGCTARYLSTFLYVSSPIVRRVVNTKMNNQSQQEGAWEERHPFKK